MILINKLKFTLFINLDKYLEKKNLSMQFKDTADNLSIQC